MYEIQSCPTCTMAIFPHITFFKYIFSQVDDHFDPMTTSWKPLLLNELFQEEQISCDSPVFYCLIDLAWWWFQFIQIWWNSHNLPLASKLFTHKTVCLSYTYLYRIGKIHFGTKVCKSGTRRPLFIFPILGKTSTTVFCVFQVRFMMRNEIRSETIEEVLGIKFPCIH